MTAFIAPVDEAKEPDDLWAHYGLPHNTDIFPKILLQRAFEWQFPEEFFSLAPTFDRCLVRHTFPIGFYKKSSEDKDWYVEGTNMVVPPSEHARLENMSPRVVLVAAGEAALGQLRTHGVDLGHICTILRTSPFRVQAKSKLGTPITLTAVRAGDIIQSEDKMRLMREGKIERKWINTEDYTGYVLRTAPGYEDDGEANFIPKDCLPANAPSWEDF